MFDNCLRNRFFNPSWPFSRLGSGNCRSVHFDHSSSDDRAWIFRFHVDRDLALEAQTFNRLLTACPQLVVVRALIYNGHIVVSDVRDVCRLIDDSHVAFGRNDGCLNGRAPN